jgi:hypothetical protein
MTTIDEQKKAIFDKLVGDPNWLKTLLVDILLEQQKLNSFFAKKIKSEIKHQQDADIKMKQLESLIPPEYKAMLGPLLNIK